MDQDEMNQSLHRIDFESHLAMLMARKDSPKPVGFMLLAGSDVLLEVFENLRPNRTIYNAFPRQMLLRAAALTKHAYVARGFAALANHQANQKPYCTPDRNGSIEWIFQIPSLPSYLTAPEDAPPVPKSLIGESEGRTLAPVLNIRLTKLREETAGDKNTPLYRIKVYDRKDRNKKAVFEGGSEGKPSVKWESYLYGPECELVNTVQKVGEDEGRTAASPVPKMEIRLIKLRDEDEDRDKPLYRIRIIDSKTRMVLFETFNQIKPFVHWDSYLDELEHGRTVEMLRVGAAARNNFIKTTRNQKPVPGSPHASQVTDGYEGIQ